ncbi:PPC domain-containing DNA-binding protein [Desulfovibrio inopinatus]|uniref:PPC domain-containing DNA-binding protein n=1 Tax=Desulfovibrio inopinatus TaxID=102109 RepID=UPI00041A9AE9|nr:PPC domain-containing DNA-binding protein [Desulfovibrio inopinatus]
MEIQVIRLHPGQDLLAEIERFVGEQRLEAACVVTCVGSLTTAMLRFANQQEASRLQGHFEIVSLTGILSLHGCHMHISLSDEQGKTFGAHLLTGCTVYTTAEIIIGIFPEYRFLRTHDAETGYPELEIQHVARGKE